MTAAYIECVFGIQAGESLREIADSLPDSAWAVLERKHTEEDQPSTRTRPRNVKDDIVMEREYYNQHLCRDDIAEFDYRPSACRVPFRVIVLRKIIAQERGQGLLHAEHRCLFYITNVDRPAKRVVELAAIKSALSSSSSRAFARCACRSPLCQRE